MDERIFVVGPAPDVHNESFKRSPPNPIHKKNTRLEKLLNFLALWIISLCFFCRLSIRRPIVRRRPTANGTGPVFPFCYALWGRNKTKENWQKKKTIRRSFCGGIERLIERGRSAKPSAKWAQLDELFTRQLVRGMDSVLWSLFFKQQNSWLERP